jgi:branched-chain amino acid transport system permease protein
MEIFLQQLVNGLGVGSIYVLVATGITLAFGVSRLINFAHGEFVVLGSYFAYALTSAGMTFWVSAPLAAIGVGAAGYVVDRGLLRRTIDAPINGFIVSLGLVIVLEGLFSEIWGSEQLKVASPVPGVVDLSGIRISADRILTFAVAMGAVVALFVVMNRTNLGRGMRAAAENRDAAALMGVRVSTAISSAFVIGGLLAGIGGAFLATLFPFNPFTGNAYIIKGLAVALIGGLGRIEGALVVGLSLGVVEALGTEYLLGVRWVDGYAFAAMVLLLVWRPEGLFGRTREI